MKCLPPAVAVFLAICFIPMRVAFPAQNGADSGLYQWTDEGGTVHYSDNPLKIPGKYEKGVKIRDSIKGKNSPDQTQKEKTAMQKPANTTGQLYGGHDEKWWRNRFSYLTAEIRMKKETLSEKQARLKKVHFKKVVSASIGKPTVLAGNPRKNRAAYQELYHEIKSDEEMVAALEKELETLNAEASIAGVPLDWKK